MRFAQPRMERFQIDAVVDDMELRLRSAEMRADFIPDHARIADDGTQARAREYTPLCGEDVAMIGIERETGPGERAEGRAAVAQPLRVHPVTGAVDVATRNAFVRLHDIEGTAGDLTAHRTCEAPVAPQAADVKRIAADHAPGGSDPRARDHGDCDTLLAERAERPFDEAFGAAVSAVALSHQGETHRL